MQLLIKEKENWTAFDKAPGNSAKENIRTKEENPKSPAVSSKNQLSKWGYYENDFFLSTWKNIFSFSSKFFSLNQLNVLLQIMLLYCHKIEDYTNKDCSWQKNSGQ